MNSNKSFISKYSNNKILPFVNNSLDEFNIANYNDTDFVT